MPTQISNLFFDHKFLTTYLFGLVIITLYAKDKFNMPTYDRAAMGPFAQLPPQSLTMDLPYRRGRTIYLFMLYCLYTAVCIVGPSTFPNLFSIFKDVGTQFQPGPQTNNAEMWPVASATFLISTGASNDSSILGKIEYFVRQYAHKTAYIPRTVRDMARYFREIKVTEWLTNSKREEEKNERRQRLVELAGKGAVEQVEKNAEQVSGEQLRWVRANVLFYTLEKLFSKSIETTEGRLDDLTDLPANRDIFASLKGTQSERRKTLIDANDNFKAGSGDAARFAKDVSLMLAVLFSQSARNQTELDDYIKRFGLDEIRFYPSEGSSFVTAVSVWLFTGLILASAILLLGYKISFLRPYVDLTGAGTSDDLKELVKSVDIFPWLATMLNATLSYLIAFRVLVYCRDSAMESREWREDFVSRFRVIMIAASVSSIFSVVAIVLFFNIINKLQYVINGPEDLLQLLALQFLLSMLLSGFSLGYLNRAPHLPFANKPLETKQPWSMWNRWRTCLKHPVPLVHALCAAILMIILSQLASANARSKSLEAVSQAYNRSLDGILTGQQWMKDRSIAQLIAAKRIAEDNSNNKHGAQETDEAKKIAREKDEMDKKAIAPKVDKEIQDMFAYLKRSPAGPIADIDSKITTEDKNALQKCQNPNKDNQGLYTALSLCTLGNICGQLNKIQLTAPPSPSERPTDCTGKSRPSVAAGTNNEAKPQQAPSASSGQSGQEAETEQIKFDPLSRAPISFTAFKDPKTCTPFARTSSDCKEQEFLGLANAFSGYYQNLQLFAEVYRRTNHFATTIVPTMIAALVAYSFGVGCLVFRAGWLREGIEQPHGEKLIKEIKHYYEVSDVNVEHILAKPLRAIGGLTPLEALRYEEFSIKLFDIIKEQSEEISAAKRVLNSADGEEEISSVASGNTANLGTGEAGPS